MKGKYQKLMMNISSLFLKKKRLMLLFGGILLFGGVASAHIFSYNWNVSPEEEIRRAMTKEIFEGEDWRRSLFAAISGSVHSVEWISCAENDGGNRPYERGAISVQYLSKGGATRQHTFSDRNYSLNGDKGIIEFYCVEEIPWVTFYACETASSGVCQSDESAEFSLSATVSSDGETFKESTSMTPEDSYLSIFTPAFFRISVTNTGAVSGDTEVIFLSEPQDGIGTPKNEAVWCEGAESCTGTPSEGKVVLKGIPPGGEVFLDYERDITPVLEETSYTEKVQIGENDIQEASIAILPPLPSSEKSDEKEESYDTNTENEGTSEEGNGETRATEENLFQFSASTNGENFSELLSIPKKDVYLDIFTPVSFQIEMHNTTEKMLEGTILLDVQDNIVSTEWQSPTVTCAEEATCTISSDDEAVELNNIPPDSRVTITYERDVRPSENLEHIETLFFQGGEVSSVQVTAE